MCLTIPGKIVSIQGSVFTIDYGSEKRIVEMSAIPVKVGDYVVVSNKIIISKLNKKKAESFLDLIK